MGDNISGLIFLSIVAIAAASFIGIKIAEQIIRARFTRRYNIGKIPRTLKVKIEQHPDGNWFELAYPSWEVSKRDRTADKRVKNNHIIWRKSELFVDNYYVYSDMPVDIIKTVKRIRMSGTVIELSAEEKKKRAKLMKSRKKVSQIQDIQTLVNNFAEKPTDFEWLCAEMFESMGYRARLTPPTNDGGYDIFLESEAGKCIVECKCYSLDNKIGRPLIQKLVGANRTVLADRMFFVTTSDFSAGAEEYAHETGVTLINGKKLLDILEKQHFLEKGTAVVYAGECQLETYDLRPYVPDDIYRKYFIRQNSLWVI